MRAQLAAVVLVGSTLFAGCSSKNKAAVTTDPAASIREVGVSEVAAYVREKSATIVDANGNDTRKEYGVIPGAVLLTSSRDYPVDVLPS